MYCEVLEYIYIRFFFSFTILKNKFYIKKNKENNLKKNYRLGEICGLMGLLVYTSTIRKEKSYLLKEIY